MFLNGYNLVKGGAYGSISAIQTTYKGILYPSRMAAARAFAEDKKIKLCTAKYLLEAGRESLTENSIEFKEKTYTSLPVSSFVGGT